MIDVGVTNFYPWATFGEVMKVSDVPVGELDVLESGPLHQQITANLNRVTIPNDDHTGLDCECGGFSDLDVRMECVNLAGRPHRIASEQFHRATLCHIRQ